MPISKSAPSHIQNCVIRHNQISAFLKAEVKKSSPVEIHASLVYKIADGIFEGSQEKPFNDQEYLLDNVEVGASHFVAATIEKEKSTMPKDNSNTKILLTEYRTKKAKQLKVMPYHIFSNRSLDILLEKMPQTIEQLLEIEGIGQKKADDYGHDILTILQTKNNDRFQESPKVEPAKVKTDDLRSLLMEYRKTRAQELDVKPYYIYTNKTLEAILERKPRTIKALLEIEGIGPKKAGEFWEGIIAIIN
ncbi:MAG: HRDC domain-containing protein [Bacillota bacterium]